MTRRLWAIAALAVCACGSAPPLALPESAGQWRKQSPDQEVTQVDITPEIHRLGLRQAKQAEYANPAESKMRLFVFRMGGQAAAFELVQKWRPAAGRLAFSVGDQFCEVRGDAGELAAAAAAFESTLKGSAR